MDKRHGFTLIELSIVLVIIGLLVGGVLVGSDLIKSAEVRATITQIEKYNQAVNVFRGKFNALPGDMPAATAAQFNFASRGQYPGEGDGNGVIEGVEYNGPGNNNSGVSERGGETVMFWTDLAQANLIGGSFTTATSNNPPPQIFQTALSLYFPQSKLSGGQYIYVWSGGWITAYASGDGANYFGLSSISTIVSGMVSSANLPVRQAYDIDRKIDDGLPQSGNVLALYNFIGPAWALGGGCCGAASGSNGPTTAATPSTAKTCYDNGNTAGAAQSYSLSQNNGNGGNCALSFKFQ